MEVIIHQVICGEQNKAWDLLKSTLPDNAAAKKIAFKTDLQDSPPSGISWQPVVRGFLFNEYYLLIKTYPDISPDVRNGRVFSHCLVISKSDVSFISNLSQLFSFFRDKIDKEIELEPISITVTEDRNIVLQDTLQLRFNKVIQSFISLLNNNGTIIWVGQKDYELAISKFWQLLSPAQKEICNFGINFNSNEVPNNKLNFITIPEHIETKFEGKGFFLVYKNDSVILTEFFEQFLAGEESAKTRIEAFTDAIEAKELSTKEISIVAKGVTTFENLNGTKDLKLLNTLAHIVAKYSQNEKKGFLFKKHLVEKICLIIETTNENDILLLKNFPIKSFKDSEGDISLATEKWIDNFLLSEKNNIKRDLASVIVQAYDLTPANWWSKLFTDKINKFGSNITHGAATIIWKWIGTNINVLKAISPSIEVSKNAETYFISTFSSSIPKSVFSEVKLFAIKNNWLRLHATIVTSEYDFVRAITEQLKVDSDITYFDAFEIIVSSVNPSKLIDLAVSSGDIKLIKLSARACKADPSLLNRIEIEKSNWQNILLDSVKNGNTIAAGIENPKETFYKLYDSILSIGIINTDLLTEISNTDFANILNYPSRDRFWAKLPPAIRSRFLEKTSASLLENLSKNPSVQVPEEEELSTYIISNGISTFLYYNSNNIKVTLPIFTTFQNLRENILVDYISNYNGRIDVIDGTQLGKLVSERNYTDVAYAIYNKARHNRQFRVALTECYHLLDFITRTLAFGFGMITNIDVSADEWWAAFTELSYQLYSSGPKENKIWTQADGHEYDLLTSGTGKEVWIAALQKLRNDRCSGITTEKLLKAMLKEHRRNSVLKTLKDLFAKL